MTELTQYNLKDIEQIKEFLDTAGADKELLQARISDIKDELRERYAINHGDMRASIAFTRLGNQELDMRANQKDTNDDYESKVAEIAKSVSGAVTVTNSSDPAAKLELDKNMGKRWGLERGG